MSGFRQASVSGLISECESPLQAKEFGRAQARYRREPQVGAKFVAEGTLSKASQAIHNVLEIDGGKSKASPRKSRFKICWPRERNRSGYLSCWSKVATFGPNRAMRCFFTFSQKLKRNFPMIRKSPSFLHGLLLGAARCNPVAQLPVNSPTS